MKKNIMIILGNGFTIDFLSHVDKLSLIDVGNLFKNGENVPWPETDKAGFLSYKHCPNLWNLGARPYLDNAETITLIEDIITCANILEVGDRKGQNVFYDAYKELAQYLYSLFIHYDSMIDFDKIKGKLGGWGWYRYFKKISKDPNIDKVYIVTFNYDIWLEKILTSLRIDFNISCFENKDSKFQIFKPHGSISFQSKIKTDKDAFQIIYTRESEKLDVKQFDIVYDNINPLGAKKAIIPPAGDSSRLNYEWAKSIRNEIKDVATKLSYSDELVMAGLSYWHVDRLEIDSILTEMKPDISEVIVINPNPPRVLNAVITTLFRNVVFHTSSKNLDK